MNLALLLASYLLVVSALAALLFLPAARRGFAAWTRHHTRAGAQAVRGVAGAVASRFSVVPLGLQRVLAGAARWRTKQWSIAGAALVALAGPPILAFWLGGHQWLGDFDNSARSSTDPQITALLQGEQLVPPEPLPPEVFSTIEAETQRPLLASASREWSALDADFQQRLLLVFKLMAERHGYRMVLLEGYRSPQRQALLASRGAQVTQAGPNESYHQFGLAADCAFFRDGKLVIDGQDPWVRRGYALYGEIAESVGLTWGGRWRSLVDLGHVELHRAVSRGAGGASADPDFRAAAARVLALSDSRPSMP
jgi:peptidoglycan L-alanyl-D-glutamate endopeptidase CwlK